MVSELDLTITPEALGGIEGFSLVTVLFWMHLVSAVNRSLLKIHPKDRQEPTLVRIIITRTRYRPDPMGMTTVKLPGCTGSYLKVQGLDAINGTPVIDIKPYLPPYDALEEVKMQERVRALGYTDPPPPE